MSKLPCLMQLVDQFRECKCPVKVCLDSPVQSTNLVIVQLVFFRCVWSSLHTHTHTHTCHSHGFICGNHSVHVQHDQWTRLRINFKQMITGCRYCRFQFFLQKRFVCCVCRCRPKGQKKTLETIYESDMVTECLRWMDNKACHVNYFLTVYVTHLFNKMSLRKKQSSLLKCISGVIIYIQDDSSFREKANFERPFRKLKKFIKIT